MILPYSRNKLWFVVVGTGRCGTVYFAKLLSEVGLPCGHERLFGPAGLQGALNFNAHNSDVAAHSGLHTYNYYVAESSYMAVPYLDHKILQSATVIHAVRNPIKVILSFHNKLQYWHSSQLNKWESFIASHLPDIHNAGSPLDKCCYYVTRWNRLIEMSALDRKYHRVRLEDGTENLLKFLGGKKIELPPSNTFEEWTQRKPSLRVPAEEKDILGGRFGKEVLKLMEDYGYVST